MHSAGTISGGNQLAYSDSEGHATHNSKHHQATLSNPQIPQLPESASTGTVMALLALCLFTNMWTQAQFPTIARHHIPTLWTDSGQPKQTCACLAKGVSS